WKRYTEELKAAAFEANAVMRRVIDHPHRRDRPARPLGATGVRCYRAGRVDCILERCDLALAGATSCSDAAAALEHHEQVLDRSVLQRVGQHDIFADQLIALRRQDDDIADRADLAR